MEGELNKTKKSSRERFFYVGTNDIKKDKNEIEKKESSSVSLNNPSVFGAI